MIRHPSPNFGPRRNGLTPTLIVLHYTAMPDAESALKRLCLPETKVSAHYLIGSRGQVWQLVDEDQRAWHAGAGSWRGMSDVNSRSIGIELDNDALSPFPDAQMAALEVLLDEIMQRWQITPSGVIGHSDMAPGRKIDPGPRFDWRRLARGGRAIWPAPSAPGQFETDAVRAGYPSDCDEKTVLAAFRLRFRPGAEGPITEADRTLMAGVAALDASGSSA